MKSVSFRDVRPAPPRPRGKWCPVPETFQDCPAPPRPREKWCPVPENFQDFPAKPHPDNALCLTVNPPHPEDFTPCRAPPRSKKRSPLRPCKCLLKLDLEFCRFSSGDQTISEKECVARWRVRLCNLVEVEHQWPSSIVS